MSSKKAGKGAKNSPTVLSPNLQTSTLGELQKFTAEKTYSPNASADIHLFYVGRDDVHSVV